MDAKALSVRDFLADIMGGDWSHFAPPSWLTNGKKVGSMCGFSSDAAHRHPPLSPSAALSWDVLANFEITSNLHEVLSPEDIRNYQRPETLGQLYSQLETAVDSFCDLPE